MGGLSFFFLSMQKDERGMEEDEEEGEFLSSQKDNSIQQLEPTL